MQSILSATEAEKDPRNLLICFDLTHFLLVNYFQTKESAIKTLQIEPELIESMSETFFDQTSCYFPINFRPPKNDPYKIKPEALKNALKQCMLVSDLMLPHYVPFLLSKISAKQLETKVDALEILQQIVMKFKSD